MKINRGAPLSFWAYFRYEDAIVNLLNPKKTATISITLKDEEGKKSVVTRRRKIIKSATRSRKDLQVYLEGKTIRKVKAQDRLDQIIFLLRNSKGKGMAKPKSEDNTVKPS